VIKHIRRFSATPAGRDTTVASLSSLITAILLEVLPKVLDYLLSH
jgi:hypothetical protein